MLVVTKLDLCRGISDLLRIMTMFHQANDHHMNWRPRGRPGRITGGCGTRHATKCTSRDHNYSPCFLVCHDDVYQYDIESKLADAL